MQLNVFGLEMFRVDKKFLTIYLPVQPEASLAPVSKDVNPFGHIIRNCGSVVTEPSS